VVRSRGGVPTRSHETALVVAAHRQPRILGGVDKSLKLVNSEIMIHINIAEAKAQLSRCLEQVERGETVILCRRSVPIAEIRPIAKRPTEPRPVGIDRGMTVPLSFVEPLPDTVLDAFAQGERPA